MDPDLRSIISNKALADELMTYLKSDDAGGVIEKLKIHPMKVWAALETLFDSRNPVVPPITEAIIKRMGRPVLYIRHGKIQEPVLQFWKDRLAPCKERLESSIPSVGRIQLKGHPRYSWVGTGWLVAPSVMVTNRHVSEVFTHWTENGIEFNLSPRGYRIRASIDFVQEYKNLEEKEFIVREVLYIEKEKSGCPDIAFLRVAQKGIDDHDLPLPIALSSGDGTKNQVVGAVGYAARDDRNDTDVMNNIFDNVYDIKRFHPGEIMDIQDDFINHDCSTLGGNSGSALLDFESGQAVALHYAGQFEKRNYAVKASTVKAKLKDIGIC